MAGQIYGFNQVFDSNGDPLPGAKLITRVPGTTTPKATYNAPDLLNPLPNPVIADSAGRFPQIWAADGAIFDLVLTDQNDVTIEGFESVAALGASSSNVDLDFGLNGRLQIVGHSGEPNIEFGDPTGDDVGGDGRIGGWNNTQGTSLEIDFATTTFTGAISPASIGTIGGQSNPVPVTVARGTIAAATTVNIPLDQTFSRWQIFLKNLTFGSSTQIQIVMSFDGGSTFKTAGTDYQYQGIFHQGTGVVTTGIPGTVAAFIPIIPFTTSTSSSGGVDITLDVMSTSSTESRLFSRFGFFSTASGVPAYGDVAGRTNAKSYGKVTNLRLFNSNTIAMSGTYTVIGMP